MPAKCIIVSKIAPWQRERRFRKVSPQGTSITLATALSLLSSAYRLETMEVRGQVCPAELLFAGRRYLPSICVGDPKADLPAVTARSLASTVVSRRSCCWQGSRCSIPTEDGCSHGKQQPELRRRGHPSARNLFRQHGRVSIRSVDSMNRTELRRKPSKILVLN